MSSMIRAGAARAGHLLQRFLSEVVVSVVTTACVAGATTLYLHYETAPVTMPTVNVSDLLSPVADAGATHFVPPSLGIGPGPAPVLAQSVAVVLPPPRPHIPLSAPTRPAVKSATVQEAARIDPVAPPAPAVLADAGGSADYADAASETTPGPRHLLGLPVPDLPEAGRGIVRHVVGWSGAVARLVP